MIDSMTVPLNIADQSAGRTAKKSDPQGLNRTCRRPFDHVARHGCGKIAQTYEQKDTPPRASFTAYRNLVSYLEIFRSMAHAIRIQQTTIFRNT